LTAQMPTLVAAWERLRRGKTPVAPNPKLSLAGNFVYMMTGKKPTDIMYTKLPARESFGLGATGVNFVNFVYMMTGKKPTDLATKTFDVALILHADHEFNASTFAARVTAATLSDLHSAIVSGIGALKGPLHGGANERCRRWAGRFKTGGAGRAAHGLEQHAHNRLTRPRAEYTGHARQQYAPIDRR